MLLAATIEVPAVHRRRRKVSMPNILQEERDRAGPVWDMSQERQLMELLVGQRFNFFVVFFSVVIAGALDATSPFRMQLILTIGSVVAIILTVAIHRASDRLHVTLEELRKDSTHPYSIVTSVLEERGHREGTTLSSVYARLGPCLQLLPCIAGGKGGATGRTLI